MYSIKNLGAGEIGINEGVHEISLGSYESMTTVFLGHAVHALDFTIQATVPGLWSKSKNLLFQVLGPTSETVYWSAMGPFTSEPVHTYIEFAEPTAGYEVRLTTVPEVSSLTSLFSGMGLLVYIRRRRA